MLARSGHFRVLTLLWGHFLLARHDMGTWLHSYVTKAQWKKPGSYSAAFQEALGPEHRPLRCVARVACLAVLASSSKHISLLDEKKQSPPVRALIALLDGAGEPRWAVPPGLGCRGPGRDLAFRPRSRLQQVMRSCGGANEINTDIRLARRSRECAGEGGGGERPASLEDDMGGESNIYGEKKCHG